MSTPETKTCPDCAEDVKVAARVCRFCGYRFDNGSTHANFAAAGTTAAANPDTIDTDGAASPESLPRAQYWRTIAYVASTVLWVLTVIPAAVSLIEEDTTEDIMASYIGAALGSLGIAALIRLVYVYFRKRSFLSPWLFVVAAVIGVLTAAGGTE